MFKAIPFEAQENRFGRRRCGAAALTMVYRSFGIATDRETIGLELDGYESNLNRARTFHLSRNAVEHGLAAIPCRLRNPWKFLITGISDDLRIILNHRIRSDSPFGHFTVLIDANKNNETICVHDPQLGPNRTLSKAELLELWTPHGTDDEITGRVAVLISNEPSNEALCKKCENRFSLKPFERYFKDSIQTVFCPWCDALQSLS